MSTSVTLSEAEIFDITHRPRPKEQLRDLVAMGIPATMRKHDNTVCVLRADLANRRSSANTESNEPQLKSSRK